MSAGNSQAREPATASRKAAPAETPVVVEASRLVTWHHDLAQKIDRLHWLRVLNDRLTAGLGPFRDRHRDSVVLEFLHGGRWLGHPLHPPLSDLPVGLWTGAVLLDVAYRDPDRVRGLGAAGTLSAAGTVAAVGAFLTGVNDWTVSDDRDRRVALFHGLLNTAAVGLQGASLGTRMAGRRGVARALSATSLSVTVAAAYLGGHLVFTRGVMVSRVAWMTGPARWTRAIPEADLPDARPIAVEVDGRHVMLYRQGGTMHALDNICGHAGGPLSRGEVTGLIVTCPLHGSRFSVADGRVVRGPANQPQPVLPTRVRNGWIEVRGAQPAPRRRTGERDERKRP